MRKLVIATLCVALNLSVFSQAINVSSGPVKKFQSLIGLWEIIGDEDSGGHLEIIDSNTIILRFMGEEKKIVANKIDFNKSPCWFDFDTKDSSTVITIRSIFEFVNSDMIKWQVFMDEERSNHFNSSKGELLYLRRSQAKSNSALYTGN
jgi:hypothetical protein